jgi:Zn-dependent protease
MKTSIQIGKIIGNMIPAFPMDCGRVLRVWLAGRMPYIKALPALITFFIYTGASEEVKSTYVTVITGII